jgi:putative transposase
LYNCRILYNEALKRKIEAYRENRKNLSRFDLQKLYKGKDVYPKIPASVKQMVFYRLERAYVNFFRKLGHFPRFKSKNRFRSFELRKYGVDYKFVNKKLKLWKDIGFIRMRGFRGGENITQGRIVKRASGWYIQYCVNIELIGGQSGVILNPVGIDMGLKALCYDSNGKMTEPPKYFAKAQRKLRIKQRKLSKAKKGGSNRNKQRIQVAKLHEHIVNQRKDFLHKISRYYVNQYDGIVIEDLNINKMLQNHHLAKAIIDASWDKLGEMISYKMEILGTHFLKVSPMFTSQKCSNCGVIVPKSLSVRTHICPDCGYVTDRDYNASKNILGLGMRLWGEAGLLASMNQEVPAFN